MNSSSKVTEIKDDIDLNVIFFAIWQGKILIIFSTILTIIMAVVYLQNATIKYSVRMVYKPVIDNSQPNYGSLSGLASLSMVELPGNNGNGDIEVFKYLLTSEEVGDVILANTELMHELFSNEFDPINNTYKMPKLSRLAIFIKKIKPFITGQDPEPYMPPNAARVATLLKNSFLQNQDRKTGLITFSSETSAPNIIVKLIDNAVNAADSLLKQRYIETMAGSLSFYQQKLSKAKSREHREALARLIVTEEKSLMLASTGNNFTVKSITRPQISLYPTSPNITTVLIIGLALGMFIGVTFVLLRNIRAKSKV